MQVSFNNFLEYPISVSWEITTACNFNCVHCRMDDEKGIESNEEMSLDKVKLHIDELSGLGIKQINFSGGEPFCRSDFLDILRYVDKKGIQIGITSNGSLIDDKLAEELSHIRSIDLVQISLDGKDAVMHNYIRGVNDAYVNAINAMKSLLKAGIRTGAVTTVMSLNYMQVEDIFHLLLALGVNSFGARRFMPVGKGGRSLTNLVLTKEQYKDHCVLWAKLVHSYENRIQLFIEEPLMGILHKYLPENWLLSGCIAGSAYGAIMANGDVRACIFVPEPLGNLKEKSFADIWTQSKLRPLFTNKTYTGKCEACSEKNICGGCRAMSYAINGKIDDYDTLCFRELM